MINVKLKVKDLKDQIDIIKSFLSSKNQMSEYIAEFFGFDIDNIKNVEIENTISKKYFDCKKQLESVCVRLQKIWDKNAIAINEEFFNIFGKSFNFNCVAYVNLNPIWPRYLDSKTFDVNINTSDDYFLTSACHEIVHFAWFEIWKETFPDIEKINYDYPNLSWLISEIVIEPIFRFSKLKEFSNVKPAYDYFYIDKIGDKTIAELANEIYSESNGIKDFQIKIYDFFKNNKETSKLIK